MKEVEILNRLIHQLKNYNDRYYPDYRLFCERQADIDWCVDGIAFNYPSTNDMVVVVLYPKRPSWEFVEAITGLMEMKFPLIQEIHHGVEMLEPYRSIIMEMFNNREPFDTIYYCIDSGEYFIDEGNITFLIPGNRMDEDLLEEGYDEYLELNEPMKILEYYLSFVEDEYIPMLRDLMEKEKEPREKMRILIKEILRLGKP